MKSRVRSKVRSKKSKSKSRSRTRVRRGMSPRRSKSQLRTKVQCNSFLKRKIRKNMDEYKQGRYVSRQQALAVSYSQLKKKSPYCSRYFKRRS